MYFALKNLDSTTKEELAASLAQIPQGVTQLNLADNFLGARRGEELVMIFRLIPRTVKSLKLYGNELFMQAGAVSLQRFWGQFKGVLSLCIWGGII